ncbi:serine/arginine repetitive matrix protein 1-like [Acanthaster planci]|uniref:Serine/arginine repetitive matrix protein 1-like n=1 Tax=Acanthaster planci TaxID=133434 RepID=A0A8B7Y462_ACAPL|nr:serine/arginine repetitive matrix protein 1-like [Acanthaster planci]
MSVSKASRGSRRGRSSSATPSVAGLKAGSSQSSRRTGQSRSHAQRHSPMKSKLPAVISDRFQTSRSGVKRSSIVSRARGHHKLSKRPAGRQKFRRAPPFTRVFSQLSHSRYFLRSASSTKTGKRSSAQRRISFQCDVARYSLRSLAGIKRQVDRDNSASDSVVGRRPRGTSGKSAGSPRDDSSEPEDSSDRTKRKRKISAQPPPPPNTPCSTPETITPPSKRARSSPVFSVKSTAGKTTRPRTAPPSGRSGTTRRRPDLDPREKNEPAAKRQRRHETVLMDLKRRLDAIRAAARKRDVVAMPTVRIRWERALDTGSNAVSVTAVVRRLKRQLAESTPIISQMSLRNGKTKFNQFE